MKIPTILSWCNDDDLLFICPSASLQTLHKIIVELHEVSDIWRLHRSAFDLAQAISCCIARWRWRFLAGPKLPNLLRDIRAPGQLDVHQSMPVSAAAAAATPAGSRRRRGVEVRSVAAQRRPARCTPVRAGSRVWQHQMCAACRAGRAWPLPRACEAATRRSEIRGRDGTRLRRLRRPTPAVRSRRASGSGVWSSCVAGAGGGDKSGRGGQSAAQLSGVRHAVHSS